MPEFYFGAYVTTPSFYRTNSRNYQRLRIVERLDIAVLVGLDGGNESSLGGSNISLTFLSAGEIRWCGVTWPYLGSSSEDDDIVDAGALRLRLNLTALVLSSRLKLGIGDDDEVNRSKS